MKKLLLSILFLALIALPAKASYETLFNFYTLKLGQKLPPVSARALEASKCGIKNYVGSYEQNIAFLDCLENNKQTNDIKSIFSKFGLPAYDYGDTLGGNIPVSATDWTLATALSSTATTIDLVDFNDIRDNAVATTSFPTKVYLVIEPENQSNAEIVVCPASSADQTNTQFTGCTRGLAFYGNSETAVTANKKAHSAGAGVIMTNVGQFFNNFVDITDAQSVAGIKTFTSSPIVPNPTTDYQAATKYYVDNVALQGGATSTTDVMGLVELGTKAEASAGTWNANRPTTLTTQMATSSSQVATTSVVVTETDGKINQNFLDLTEDFTINGDVTLNGATTIANDSLTKTTMLAGETITGATLPVPVFIATTSNYQLTIDKMGTADVSYSITATGDVTAVQADVARGQAFNTGSSQTSVRAIIVQLKKSATPTGNVNMRLYATSGGVPTGNALATSTYAFAENLTSSYRDIIFVFDPAVTVTANTQYAFTVSSPSNSGSNYIVMNYKDPGTYGDGTWLECSNQGKTCTTSAGVDSAYFKIYATEYYSPVGKVFMCDANDNDSRNWDAMGFATSNSTYNNTITVQTSGIVGGFSSLTPGRYYYVSDTVGTVGTTAGTVNMRTGFAATTTKIQIK